jgi:hypothetical protein
MFSDLFKKGPDKSDLFGKEHTDWEGNVWRLVSQNDLNVPYFAKVKNGRVGKTLYTLTDGEQLCREWSNA